MNNFEFDPFDITFVKNLIRKRIIERAEREEQQLTDQINKAQKELLDTSRDRIDAEVRDIAAGQGSGATKESVEKELFERLSEDPRDKQLKDALQNKGFRSLAMRLQI